MKNLLKILSVLIVSAPITTNVMGFSNTKKVNTDCPANPAVNLKINPVISEHAVFRSAKEVSVSYQADGSYLHFSFQKKDSEFDWQVVPNDVWSINGLGNEFINGQVNDHQVILKVSQLLHINPGQSLTFSSLKNIRIAYNFITEARTKYVNILDLHVDPMISEHAVFRSAKEVSVSYQADGSYLHFSFQKKDSEFDPRVVPNDVWSINGLGNEFINGQVNDHQVILKVSQLLKINPGQSLTFSSLKNISIAYNFITEARTKYVNILDLDVDLIKL